MNNSFNYIPFDQTKNVNLASNEGPKVIAVQLNASKGMIAKYNEATKAVSSPVVEQPVIQDVAPVENLAQTPTFQEAPVNNQTISQPNVVGGASFEPAPAELSPSTPISDMIQPFNLENTPGVQTAAVPAKETPVVVEAPVNNTSNTNILSDEELIRQIKVLLDQSSIKEQAVKSLIMDYIKMGVHTSQVLNHLDTTRVETAELASTTRDLAQASQQNQPAVQPMQNTQTQVQEGPTLYQQAA